jgi:hypothetical protein
VSDEMRRLKQALRVWREQTEDPFYDAGFRESVEKKYQR